MTDDKNLKSTLRAMGVHAEFVTLDQDVRGVLYSPVHPNEKTRIAILVMHSNVDYLTHDILGMAQFGYTVLCANVASQYLLLDRRLRNVQAAMRFLRGAPGVQRVVLWGHSGGATLLSAYQLIAENGPAVCQGPEKLHPCSGDLDDLLPADGLMLIDANWGNAVMMLLSLDPALTDEDGAAALDPSLDLFRPENGFRPGGSSFPDAFIRRFQRAQGQRSRRLIARAQQRLARLERGEAFYTDDEPFVVAGAAQGFLNNKLFAQDVRLFAHTAAPHPLLHADGSVTHGVVPSLRRPANDVSFTRSFYEGALITTLRNFLAEFAVRTAEDYGYDDSRLYGVDWSSTYASPVSNVSGIRVPTLVMGMTAGLEYIASESIYERSASGDKSICFVEGAQHTYKTARDCEAFPGQFGDTLALTLAHCDAWLAAPGRFL